jgi:ABC-type transport system involved in multi-copper enzyme maturation permease subunit
MMLRTIIRKEVMDSVSTLKFVVAFAVVVVLVISGLTLGSRNYLEQRGEVNKQRQLNQKTLESQFDWLNAGWAGVIESKKPYVLTTIDSGIDNSLGRLAYVDTLQDARLDESRNLISPILAVFGEVDITFVVKIILSLFVILLTYDAVSGEKERGTLKLTLANDVPRYKLLLGKIIGGFTVIAISFILPLLIGLAFLMSFYSQVLGDFTSDSWWRLLLIVVVYLLYLAVFFSVGIMVSSLSHRSSTSFVVLLVIWVVFATIVPRISLAASERLRPYESYTALQTKAYKEISEKRAEVIKDFLPRFIQVRNRGMMQAFMGGSQQQPASNELSRMMTDFWRGLTDVQREVMDTYDLQYDRQQRAQIDLAESISRYLSPTSAMSFAVENLAGSGWVRQKEYVDQLRKFRNDFMDYIFSESEKVKFESMWDMMDKQKLDVDIARISFNFQEESLGAIFSRTMGDMAVLIIMSLVFFAASFVAFIRYDVR